MGNSGLRKMLSPMDIVQNKYSDLTQIQLLTLDKNLVQVPDNHSQDIVFVHYHKTIPDKQLQTLQSNPNIKVVLIPDDSCPLSFDEIKQKYPQSFAKINFNGTDMHPLSKYLKRNCPSLYNRYAVGAAKLTSPIGAFLVHKGPVLSNVDYFNEYEFNNMFAELDKRLKLS